MPPPRCCGHGSQLARTMLPMPTSPCWSASWRWTSARSIGARSMTCATRGTKLRLMLDQAKPAKPHRTMGDRLRMVRGYAIAFALALALSALGALGFAPFGVHEAMFDLD